jgi:GNAT superfamily N-acetyltransferase
MDGFLSTNCEFSLLDKDIVMQCQPFSCGDDDLDDFFLNNADNYAQQLLGKSYCYRLKEDSSVIVGAFTLSNSSIDAKRLPNNRKKILTDNIPYEKRLSSYPATLIGRLGVSKTYRKKGIGTELMDFIKLWIFDPANKTACRYLTVDAYNDEGTRKYYEANGFKCLFSTEQQEKEYIGFPEEKELQTRIMYFDLILLQEWENKKL